MGIQLKGTEKLDLKNNRIKFSLPPKHLIYYFDKVKDIPIFLIVVDTINKKSHWLFLQKYLKEEILNKNWRNQKKVSVYIKIENEINDIEEFRKSVLEANNYMKELWPSSVPSSIKKEKEYFKNLDSRFKTYSINVNDDKY